MRNLKLLLLTFVLLILTTSCTDNTETLVKDPNTTINIEAITNQNDTGGNGNDKGNDGGKG